MPVIQITAKELQKKLLENLKPLVLDVRELDEFEFANITGSLHIPLNQVPQRSDEIDCSLGCVIICHHGIRSQYAAKYLADAGFHQIYNLSGGIDAWSVECDNTVSRY